MCEGYSLPQFSCVGSCGIGQCSQLLTWLDVRWVGPGNILWTFSSEPHQTMDEVMYE